MSKANNNLTQEVKKRMRELMEAKSAQLAEIESRTAEARARLEAAGAAIQKATEEMNVDSYETAKAQAAKAQAALDMYTARYDQLKAKEYISEAESDKVIDSLLEYERELEADFKAAMVAPLQKLAKLHADYVAAVNDAENTMAAWQQDIHVNYRTRGSMTREDPLTGERTDRMERPVPVHRMYYGGCDEAARLGRYLENEAKLLKETDA